MNLQKLSDTSKLIPFYMADASAPLNGKTTLTPLIRLSKNCGTFANAVGGVSELEAGNYVFHPNASDLDTPGPLVVRATASGAVDFTAKYTVVPFDPYAVADLGLTSIAALVAGVNVTSLAGSSPAALVLKALGLSVVTGVVSNDATPTIAGFTANISTSPNLQFVDGFYAIPAPGQMLVLWSGAAISKTTHVTTYTVTGGTVGTFGFALQLPVAPAVGDSFMLLSL